MKKVLVLYKSKTGFSERYARWIAEDLQCDLANLSDFKKESLSEYSLVIWRWGLRRIRVLAKSNAGWKLPEKTWVVYATGATPLKKIRRSDLSTSAKASRPAHFYYFIAGINYEKMSLIDRLLMRFFFSPRKSSKRGLPNKPQWT